MAALALDEMEQRGLVQELSARMTVLQTGAKAFEVMMASVSVASAGVATATSCEWQAEVLAVRWSRAEESPHRYFVEVLPRIGVCEFSWPAVALMVRRVSSAVV
jgi:hypothetical protein